MLNLSVKTGLQRWEAERRRWLGHDHDNGEDDIIVSSLSASRQQQQHDDGGVTTSDSNSNGGYERSRSMHHEIARAVDIDVDEIIDIILSNRWRTYGGGAGYTSGEEKKDGTFPRTVPLPQMVDILVDLWEAEGLDM